MINWQDSRDFFCSQFQAEPEICCFAPGRVNLIGEHIDYAGGQVLPLSISLGVTLAVRLTAEGGLRVASSLYPGQGVASLEETGRQGPVAYLRELVRITGCLSAEIAICSDLPPGRGLSSSAAVGIAVQAALLALLEEDVLPSARAVCRAAQRAEHTALGTHCGLMDQYASLFGRETEALLIDTWQQTHEYIPLSGLEGCSLLLVDSGQSRELADSEYNTRQAELQEALRLAAEALGGFTCFRERTLEQLLEVAEGLPAPLDSRLRHVATEQQRVLDFSAALQGGNAKGMGCLLIASHSSMRDDCEVSTPQIDRLVDMLCNLPPCLGARLVGGGFGGGVLALLRGSPDPASLDDLLGKYHAATGLQGDWQQLQSGHGACLLAGKGSWRSLAEWLS